MPGNNHTECSILINVPITFALESLWELLHQENKWTERSKISKNSANQILRNVSKAEIDVKQKITKQPKQRKINFENQTGNLNGTYSYQFDQTGKGQVILTYESNASRNGLAWPPKYSVEQELIQLKNALEVRHHGPKTHKTGFCC